MKHRSIIKPKPAHGRAFNSFIRFVRSLKRRSDE
jgi:hypothetical protein